MEASNDSSETLEGGLQSKQLKEVEAEAGGSEIQGCFNYIPGSKPAWTTSHPVRKKGGNREADGEAGKEER